MARRHIGTALHIKLAIVLMHDLEAQPLVEPHGGIDFHDVQEHCLIELCGLSNQALHHLCPDTPSLKVAVHKELCNKKLIILREGL